MVGFNKDIDQGVHNLTVDYNNRKRTVNLLPQQPLGNILQCGAHWGDLRLRNGNAEVSVAGAWEPDNGDGVLGGQAVDSDGRLWGRLHAGGVGLPLGDAGSDLPEPAPEWGEDH